MAEPGVAAADSRRRRRSTARPAERAGSQLQGMLANRVCAAVDMPVRGHPECCIVVCWSVVGAGDEWHPARSTPWDRPVTIAGRQLGIIEHPLHREERRVAYPDGSKA